MESIYCHFARLSDFTVDKLLYAYGVYVIWSGNSQGRPSYIGEGDIWARLAQHRKKFPSMDEYAAIIGVDYKQKKTKRDIQIVEAVLLEICTETDRHARHNGRGGNFSKVRPLFNRHGAVEFQQNSPSSIKTIPQSVSEQFPS